MEQQWVCLQLSFEAAKAINFYDISSDGLEWQSIRFSLVSGELLKSGLQNVASKPSIYTLVAVDQVIMA